jgi:hypothetical protein
MDDMSVWLDGWTASGEASLHGFRGGFIWSASLLLYYM